MRVREREMMCVTKTLTSLSKENSVLAGPETAVAFHSTPCLGGRERERKKERKVAGSRGMIT